MHKSKKYILHTNLIVTINIYLFWDVLKEVAIKKIGQPNTRLRNLTFAEFAPQNPFATIVSLYYHNQISQNWCVHLIYLIDHNYWSYIVGRKVLLCAIMSFSVIQLHPKGPFEWKSPRGFFKQ